MNRERSNVADIHDRQESADTFDDSLTNCRNVDVGLEPVRAIARRRRKTNARVVDEFVADRREEAAKDCIRSALDSPTVGSIEGMSRIHCSVQ